jgi:hypothetical protein
MDYVSAIGPGSDLLPRNQINGRTVVSRNGEITQNAFIDHNVWNKVCIRQEKASEPYKPDNPFASDSGLVGTNIQNERLPPFYEWATTQVGFICVFDRSSSANYRNRVEAETAVPVISCAQLLTENDNRLFEFAGVCRSASVRDYDDQQNGMKFDDHFTLAIGGMVTILNNSNKPINRGDLIEWTFLDESDMAASVPKRQKVGPRRIQVRKAVDSTARVIGKAMSSARRYEQFDLLIQPQ